MIEHLNLVAFLTAVAAFAVAIAAGTVTYHVAIWRVKHEIKVAFDDQLKKMQQEHREFVEGVHEVVEKDRDA